MYNRLLITTFYLLSYFIYLVRTISNLLRVHSHNDSGVQDLIDLFRPEI